jgi:hypothetical protein
MHRAEEMLHKHGNVPFYLFFRLLSLPKTNKEKDHIFHGNEKKDKKIVGVLNIPDFSVE